MSIEPRAKPGKQSLCTVPNGVMHIPLTPLNDDMTVDYDTFEKLVDWHVRQSPSSLCVILHIAESVRKNTRSSSRSRST